MGIYVRLSLAEREEISRFLAQKMGIRAIGRNLGRDGSTISREVRRCCSSRCHYRAVRAERRAQRNSKKRRLGKRKLLLRPRLAGIIRAKLLLKWSPEQIAKWLKREYDDSTMHIAAETIYSYVYVLPRGKLKAELLRSLRREHQFRRKRGRKAREPVVAIEDMLSIEERPAEVADRVVPGHWEGDLIVGGRREQSVLGTLVERTTRTVLLVPLKTKRADEVRRAFAREMKRLPQQMRLSLTYDQGREMAQHKLFTKSTQVKVYFAHPRSPWERGTNENTNGLIRQFFPKGTNFRMISRREIKRAQHLLNGRPRKVLDFRTPYEAMQEVLR